MYIHNVGFNNSTLSVSPTSHASFFREDFGAQRIYGSFGAVISGVVVGLWRYRETVSGLRGSVADFAPMIAAYVAGSCLNILALSRVRLKSEMEDRVAIQ